MEFEFNKEEILEPINKSLLMQEYCMKCDKHVVVYAPNFSEEYCNKYDDSCYDSIKKCVQKIKLNKKLKKIKNV